MLFYNVNEPLTAFRVKVARITCVLIGIHLSLALVSLLLPAEYSPSKVITLYRKYILVGPFFQDKKITHSTHLYVAYFTEGKWTTPRDYGFEDYIHYTKYPWRYDKLHGGDYATYAAWSVSKVRQQNIKSSKSFRELNQYVTSALIRRQVDSVSLVYLEKHFQPKEDNYRLDTLFVYKYDPRNIDAGKKLD